MMDSNHPPPNFIFMTYMSSDGKDKSKAESSKKKHVIRLNK